MKAVKVVVHEEATSFATFSYRIEISTKIRFDGSKKKGQLD